MYLSKKYSEETQGNNENATYIEKNLSDTAIERVEERNGEKGKREQGRIGVGGVV